MSKRQHSKISSDADELASPTNDKEANTDTDDSDTKPRTRKTKAGAPSKRGLTDRAPFDQELDSKRIAKLLVDQGLSKTQVINRLAAEGAHSVPSWQNWWRRNQLHIDEAEVAARKTLTQSRIKGKKRKQASSDDDDDDKDAPKGRSSKASSSKLPTKRARKGKPVDSSSDSGSDLEATAQRLRKDAIRRKATAQRLAELQAEKDAVPPARSAAVAAARTPENRAFEDSDEEDAPASQPKDTSLAPMSNLRRTNSTDSPKAAPATKPKSPRTPSGGRVSFNLPDGVLRLKSPGLGNSAAQGARSSPRPSTAALAEVEMAASDDDGMNVDDEPQTQMPLLQDPAESDTDGAENSYPQENDYGTQAADQFADMFKDTSVGPNADDESSIDYHPVEFNVEQQDGDHFGDEEDSQARQIVADDDTSDEDVEKTLVVSTDRPRASPAPDRTPETGDEDEDELEAQATPRPTARMTRSRAKATLQTNAPVHIGRSVVGSSAAYPSRGSRKAKQPISADEPPIEDMMEIDEAVEPPARQTESAQSSPRPLSESNYSSPRTPVHPAIKQHMDRALTKEQAAMMVGRAGLRVGEQITMEDSSQDTPKSSKQVARDLAVTQTGPGLGLDLAGGREARPSTSTLRVVERHSSVQSQDDDVESAQEEAPKESTSQVQASSSKRADGLKDKRQRRVGKEREIDKEEEDSDKEEERGSRRKQADSSSSSDEDFELVLPSGLRLEEPLPKGIVIFRGGSFGKKRDRFEGRSREGKKLKGAEIERLAFRCSNNWAVMKLAVTDKSELEKADKKLLKRNFWSNEDDRILLKGTVSEKADLDVAKTAIVVRERRIWLNKETETIGKAKR